MKRIEDIERMSLEELESVSDERDVKVPGILESRISGLVEAACVIEDIRSAKPAAWKRTALAGGIAAAAGLALVIGFGLPQQPRDTFDDPMAAYAELEKTFAYISDKMDRGLELASEAGFVIEKTTEVFNKQNN